MNELASVLEVLYRGVVLVSTKALYRSVQRHCTGKYNTSVQ